jgi:hypothetical protein
LLAQAGLRGVDTHRRLRGLLSLLERKAHLEAASKSSKGHRAADKDTSYAGSLRILRRIVAQAERRDD